MVQALRTAAVAIAAAVICLSTDARATSPIIPELPIEGPIETELKAEMIQWQHPSTGETVVVEEINIASRVNKFFKWNYERLKPNTHYDIHVGNYGATCHHFEVSKSEFQIEITTDHDGKAKGEVSFDSRFSWYRVKFLFLKRPVAIVNAYDGQIVSCGKLKKPKITCANVFCQGHNAQCYETHAGPVCIGSDNYHKFNPFITK